MIDHNSCSEANGSFKFKNVPPPAKDDLGAKAKLTLVDVAMDSNGADLSVLTDGISSIVMRPKTATIGAIRSIAKWMCRRRSS